MSKSTPSNDVEPTATEIMSPANIETPTTPAAPVSSPFDDQSIDASFDQLQAEVKQLQEELPHLQRLAFLGTMVAGVAHEINNMLTPIITYGQLAAKNPNDLELLQKTADRSLHNAERAHQLLSSLLGMSRAESPDQTAELRSCLAEVLTCKSQELRQQNIQIRVDAPEVWIDMPSLELQQVLINIIHNAIRAMASNANNVEQGGRIEIETDMNPTEIHLTHPNDSDDTARASCLAANGAQCLLRIFDTGPGIPSEIQNTLFNAFVTHSTDFTDATDATDITREEAPDTEASDSYLSLEDELNSDTLTQPGTGLGLHLCRQLLQKAGGDIHLDPTYQLGACFIVTLPVLAQPCK